MLLIASSFLKSIEPSEWSMIIFIGLFVGIQTTIMLLLMYGISKTDNSFILYKKRKSKNPLKIIIEMFSEQKTAKLNVWKQKQRLPMPTYSAFSNRTAHNPGSSSYIHFENHLNTTKKIGGEGFEYPSEFHISTYKDAGNPTREAL